MFAAEDAAGHNGGSQTGPHITSTREASQADQPMPGSLPQGVWCLGYAPVAEGF